MAETWVQRLGGVRMERARHEWSDVLPVMLRTAVHAPVSRGRFRPPLTRRLVLVKWVIDGEAAIGVHGRRYTLEPGDVAVYVPTHPHEFWSRREGTEMCWFSIDGPLAEPFVQTLGLRAGAYPFGPAPVEGVDELIASLEDQSLAGCRRSSLLAVQMLYAVAERLPAPKVTSVVPRVRQMIRDGLSDPELSAQRLASQLDYNRGALSRLFHQQTGMTIIDCITQTRLQEAEMLLTRTDERIGDVARKCGFRDRSYFTRWIRKHTGRLPREIRQSTSSSREAEADAR